jgi:hypothetical protein
MSTKKQKWPASFEIPAEGMLGLLAYGAEGLIAWREKRAAVEGIDWREKLARELSEDTGTAESNSNNDKHQDE